ncbi:unnamed protein product [Bathycoccus prasinos]
MLVKAIDYFESIFVPASDAMVRDCSLAETEDCAEKRRRLKTLAYAPLVSSAYFIAVMISRRKVEFIGNAVLCVLHAILLRQTANQVREQTVSSVNHAEQVCNLFALLFWSKAYASLYSMGGEAFQKSRVEAIADSCMLVFQAYILYVSSLAFRRLSFIYALYLVQKIDGENKNISTSAASFEVDKHGNWSRLDAVNAAVDIVEEVKEEERT